MNRAGRVAGWVVALALCGTVALGVTRWTDIQFELGYAYENGDFHGWTPGFSRDYREASRWMSRAALANHPRAQYRLGILHAHGWGVPEDKAQSVAWFTRSARNGYAPACYHLGWMLHKGEDVPRDEGRAVQLLEQAAEQGMAAAHLALGRFYERGEGVPVDVAQAYKWYTLAVSFARTRPEWFDNAAIAKRAQAAHDALALQLDTSSEAQGRMLARQWLAKLSAVARFTATGAE